MDTEVIKVDPENPAAELIKKAARILKQGGLVVIPTETVYGIAANMANPSTLERLSRVKQRPKDKPFSIHVADQEEAEKLAKDILPAAYRLMESFWPMRQTAAVRAISISGCNR